MPSNPIAASWSKPSRRGRSAAFLAESIGPAFVQAAQGVSAGLVGQAQHERGRTELLADQALARQQRLADVESGRAWQGTMEGVPQQEGEPFDAYGTRVAGEMGRRRSLGELRAAQTLATHGRPAADEDVPGLVEEAGLPTEAAPFWRELPAVDEEMRRAKIAALYRPRGGGSGLTPIDRARAMAERRARELRVSEQGQVAEQQRALRAEIEGVKGEYGGAVAQKSAWMRANPGQTPPPEMFPRADPSYVRGALNAIRDKYPMARRTDRDYMLSGAREATALYRVPLRDLGLNEDGTPYLTDAPPGGVPAVAPPTGIAAPAAAPAPEPQLADFPRTPEGVAAYNRAYDAWEAAHGTGVPR